MDNSKKAVVIFLVCLIGMAGVAFVMKALKHGGSAMYAQGIKSACSEDNATQHQALESIKKAAEEGDAQAAMFLAQLFAGGMPEGVEPVQPDAFKCLAELVKPDGAEARRYLDMAAGLEGAVETLDPKIAYRYAILYMSAPFASHDEVSEFHAQDVADRLLDTAAKSGSSDFILNLAALCESKGNYAEALKLYEKAAELAPDFKLELKIGDYYLYGRGTDVNPSQATVWYQKAQKSVEAQKELEPEKRQHMLDIVSVRMDIAGRKLDRSGGAPPVTVRYLLAGNGNHYIVKAIGKQGGSPITAGEVIKTEKGIKAVVAKDVKLPENSKRERDGFSSMNEAMIWVLEQWAKASIGENNEYVFRIAD